MAADTQRREKIAILGGGIASLTAAYELAVQDRYDITVYQLGWRLGGKGASGRNQEIADRIEEHGLHIWFGFYENAFNLMRKCYDEVQNVPSVTRGEYRPFSSYKKAFTGQDSFLFTEMKDGEVLHWPMDFPSDDDYPGQPNADGQVTMMPSAWDYFVRILEYLDGHFDRNLRAAALAHPSQKKPSGLTGLLFRLWNWIKRLLGMEVEKLFHLFLSQALRLARSLDREVEKHDPAMLHVLGELLRHFKHWLNGIIDDVVEGHDGLRRDWIILDLGITCLLGLLSDGVLTRGFECINNEDFREWLKRHEASPDVLESSLIRSLYDIFFGYEGGDISKPNVEAGCALRGSLRTMLTYKGHILFKMNAGMGDAIFAPIYLVLKERYGVKFKFFHRVKELKLTPDGNEVGEVQLARQVTLRGGKPTQDYNPLINVNGLPCWPNRPDQSQVVEDLGQTPENPEGTNLESRWADWRDADDQVSLIAGEHFDRIVLGISIAALPFITPQLRHKSDSWRNMLDKIATVVTQSVQLWFKPNETELGWPVKGGLIGGYYEAFASWGDFNQLDGQENWPAGSEQSVYYSCGVLPDPGIPDRHDRDFPDRELRVVKKNALDYVEKYSQTPWPNASAPDGKLDFGKLTDLENRSGQARMDAQFLRVNIDPSERYVLTLKDTSRFRLKAGEADFDNLTLTGTWIDNGFNLSCIEAAVMSGMQAARALSGEPIDIVGEDQPEG